MNSKLITLVLLMIAVIGMGMSWGLYPVENRFSIMRCTISFLGSPDPDRNPVGWRWYQFGMTSLIVALGLMIWRRHQNFHSFTRTAIRKSTALYTVGFVLILISIWLADSDKLLWGRIRSGDVHNVSAVIAILTLLVAVFADGVILSRAGFPRTMQWPIRIYQILWAAAMVSLATWEWKCNRDPGLKHWPGDGIHSTPLWEWILFVYLIGFVIWISRRELAERMPVEK